MSSSHSHDAAPGKQIYFEHSDTPPLSAAFAIKFDLKVGYTIAWKRSAPGVQLDGSVEFKSLPSGLHTVPEDLVYFRHEQYAGLSAFVNAPAAEEERNASLVAVGILVPLSNARLGRGWLHAKELRELAHNLALDVTKTKPLEHFWDHHKAKTVEEAHAKNSKNGTPNPTDDEILPSRRRRALSNLSSAPPLHQTLPPYHPALSMMEFVELFGPLIFPIWRAALLRKRILLLSSPPVRRLCEYVFDISILSKIPSALSDLLSPDSENLHRIRPLFQVGIHDIPLLEREAKSIKEAARERSELDSEGKWDPFGFLGCTTDEVLQEKTQLYDIIVEIPSIPENEPQKRQWPRIKTSDSTEMKASHRDLRRWKLLRDEITRLDQDSTIYHEDDDDNNEDDEDDEDMQASSELEPDDAEQNVLLQRSTSFSPNDPGYEDKLIEPMTWSQLAYSGFMWWAAAGERDAGQSDEEEKDRQVLGRLSDYIPPSPRLPRSDGKPSTRRSKSASSSHASITVAESAGLHTGIIAYFHRLTTQMFNTMAEVVESADDDEGQGSSDVSQEAVHVTSEDLSRMGLDAWSIADVNFVRDSIRMYFGREAEVHSQSIECCGIKVC